MRHARLHPHLRRTRAPRVLARVGMLALLACALPLSAQDDDRTGVFFDHEDWELTCDNTGTCRAAGYHSDEGGPPISVLLTRAAGPGTPVQAELLLGGDWDDSDATQLPAPQAIALWIDNRNLGRLRAAGGDNASRTGSDSGGSAALNAAQTAALLAALRRDSAIEARAGEETWTLSDKGASAVLLKMDEAQGRIGTPGALRRPGKRAEKDVPAARPKPIVQAARPLPARPGDATFLQRHGEALRSALRKATGDDDCDALHATDSEDPDAQALEIVRLTDRRLLVSSRCWIAAYNIGNGFWIVDDAPPFRPQLVTTSGSEYTLDADRGVLAIHDTHKARGLGDCWSSETRTWDGTRFVLTESQHTGQCKGFAGGAWTLPGWVSEVR